MSERLTPKGIAKRFLQQVPLLIGLVVLWMLLWSTISWLSLLTGILVALFVTRAFYLPPVELSGRFNVLWFLAYLWMFARKVFVASFQVAYLAVRPKPLGQSSIVAVDLVTRSDFIITLTALTISLIPGSVVIEVDRGRSILYLHALGVGDSDAVEALRAEVLSVEQSLVRALGSREDIRRSAQ